MLNFNTTDIDALVVLIHNPGRWDPGTPVQILQIAQQIEDGLIGQYFTVYDIENLFPHKFLKSCSYK